MNDSRILRFARHWALNEISFQTETYDTSLIKVYLDVSQVEEHIQDFLMEVPQSFCLWTMKLWWSEKHDDVIVYDNGKESSFPELKIFMKFFKDGNITYMGLYTQDGKRWGSRCLMIYKDYKWNSCYAGGRCPYQL